MININHNAYDNGTFGSNDNGRYGGVFRYPNGRVRLRISDRGSVAVRTGGTYRKAQRTLLQFLKGYNV